MTPLLVMLLVLACALATNVGFVYKHRGACAAPAVDMPRPLRSGRALFCSPLFAFGMAIAAGARILHFITMWLAPLSLVQSGLAGIVMLLTVVVERFFPPTSGPRH